MMKKMIGREYYKNIIAGILVVIMAVTDLMAAFCIPTVEYEEHEMDTYLADGNYNRRDSDLPSVSDVDDFIPICLQQSHIFICYQVQVMLKVALSDFT